MTAMKHKAFMRENKLEISDFTEPVQRKVRIFDQMQSKLKETTGEDHSELSGKLASLDLELCADMLDQMEDRLENNEEVEVASDEEILEELWKMKRTRGLKRSSLEKYGIKTRITGWTLRIGKFVLRRTATFSYIYDLEKLAPTRKAG
ncbi:MAG: hypothetical protein KDD04_02605 [Sinomicrobium sp.]|nr:hypothetical protein [Sinomicrobium sp.]